jgi:hypothetical protein
MTVVRKMEPRPQEIGERGLAARRPQKKMKAFLSEMKHRLSSKVGRGMLEQTGPAQAGHRKMSECCCYRLRDCEANGIQMQNSTQNEHIPEIW